MVVGDRLVYHGVVGSIVHVLDGLEQACELGWLSRDGQPQRAAELWLAAQDSLPKTPRTGRWYAVDLKGYGSVLVGSVDAEPLC